MADLEYTQYGERMLVEEGYSIQELIDILLSHIKLIFVITLVAGLLSFVISQFFITPYYEASVKLFVNNSRANQTETTSISDLNASERLVNTYMEIVKSNTVLDKVAANRQVNYTLEELKKMVGTQAVQNTEIFYVTVTSDNPRDAKLIANQIATDAPSEIMDFVEATSVKVIDYATLPTSPSTPNVKLNTAIGFLLGLVISVLLVFLLDMIDVRIRSEEDLKKLVELPILGIIPSIESEGSKRNAYGYGGYHES
ncbi:MAG: Wzz/FepE/Etk N-terminal domain-containing protein [Eubacteriales bacterium]|nr:Wzz/FepE/Etk N-terminal domain-containing protein [Eubacteriales bacterium]